MNKKLIRKMQTVAGGPLRIKFTPEQIAYFESQGLPLGMNNSEGQRLRTEGVQAQLYQEQEKKRKEEEIKSRMEMRPTLKRRATTAEKLRGKKDEYKQVPLVVGMSGTDPVGEFILTGIGLNGVGALAKTGLWNVAKYAPTTQLGNYGRLYFVGNAFKSSFNGTKDLSKLLAFDLFQELTSAPSFKITKLRPEFNLAMQDKNYVFGRLLWSTNLTKDGYTTPQTKHIKVIDTKQADPQIYVTQALYPLAIENGGLRAVHEGQTRPIWLNSNKPYFGTPTGVSNSTNYTYVIDANKFTPEMNLLRSIGGANYEYPGTGLLPIEGTKRILWDPILLLYTSTIFTKTPKSEIPSATSLKFFERRPSRISEAEKLGVPKGERNAKQGYLLKDAIEEANKFAEKWGYDKLSQNATLLDIENLYNQHNTFFRGVTTEQLENTRNRVAKELGINPELLTNDLYLLYVSTHPWPGNDRIWVTPFSHYGKIYGNSDMIGGKGLLSAVMRPWKTTKDIKQWPKLSLWTLGFKEDVSNPVITPWVSNAPDAIRSLGALSEFLVKSPLIYRGLGKDFKGTFLLYLKYKNDQGKLGWIESLVGELPLEIIIEKQGGKMNILEFLKNGSGIHIKEKNKGKFTKSAKAAGLSVQEHAKSVLNDPNATPLLKKRANFARNAAKWKHKEGGIIPIAQKGIKAGLKAKQNLTKRKNPDWDNLDRGYRYLTQDRGLPHDLAIALMGNVVEESRGNYKAVQKNGGGRGLIQWDGLPAPSSRYGLWGKIWASVAKPANVYDRATDTVKNYWAPYNGLKGEQVRLEFIKAPLKKKAEIYAISALRPGLVRIADRQLSTMQLDSIYNPKIKNIILKEGGIIKALEGVKYPVFWSNESPEYTWADNYFKNHPDVTGMAIGGGALGPDDLGPRKILRNPYSNIITDHNDPRWKSLDLIESIRHYMNEINYRPNFKISPELENFRKSNFKKTDPYNIDDNAWRQSIISRIAAKDMKGTPELMEEYNKFIKAYNNFTPKKKLGGIIKALEGANTSWWRKGLDFLNSDFAKLLVNEDDINEYKLLRALEKALNMLAIQGSGGTNLLEKGFGLLKDFLGPKLNSSNITFNTPPLVKGSNLNFGVKSIYGTF